jgi:hypothetical protein
VSTPKLVAFRPDQPPRRLTKRFPRARPQIEALWRRDGEFREICRDYREARASLRLLTETEGRDADQAKEELSALLAEIEGEMFSLVEQQLEAP